jgi:predicted XRE-type DNA-binding protein
MDSTAETPQVISDIPVIQSTGNVFVDLGMEEAEEHLVKVALASRIDEIIKHRHLTQAKAAELLGLDQPKISRLVRGKVREFSLDRLFRLLNALDRDIEIVVRKKPASRPKGRIQVVAA